MSPSLIAANARRIAQVRPRPGTLAPTGRGGAEGGRGSGRALALTLDTNREQVLEEAGAPNEKGADAGVAGTPEAGNSPPPGKSPSGGGAGGRSLLSPGGGEAKFDERTMGESKSKS